MAGILTYFIPLAIVLTSCSFHTASLSTMTMNTFISKRTGRLAVSSFFLLITLLLTFAADLIIAPHVSGADGDTSLTVNIDYPPDGVEICYCSNFNVGVTIINTAGQIALNTIAWIEIIGNASLVSGETVQKGPVDLGTDNWYPWWTLHCDGAGDVTIVVHTQADNAPEQTDSVTISQLKPHLVVDITTPQDGTGYPAGSIRCDRSGAEHWHAACTICVTFYFPKRTSEYVR
jgi:hypothetical protein